MLYVTVRTETLIAKGIAIPKLREYSHISDDDPLYDSVASDDDYAVVAGAEQVMLLLIHQYWTK